MKTFKFATINFNHFNIFHQPKSGSRIKAFRLDILRHCLRNHHPENGFIPTKMELFSSLSRIMQIINHSICTIFKFPTSFSHNSYGAIKKASEKKFWQMTSRLEYGIEGRFCNFMVINEDIVAYACWHFNAISQHYGDALQDDLLCSISSPTFPPLSSPVMSRFIKRLQQFFTENLKPNRKMIFLPFFIMLSNKDWCNLIALDLRQNP